VGLHPTSTGKVRDLFDLGDRLLIVACDRISAYDVVLDDLIPGKGAILTRMSVEWCRILAGIVPHHVISTDPSDFPPPFDREPALPGRSMLVHKARRLDVECIVRGYLAGSAWREYQQTESVSGLRLPAGLRCAERLAHPIFTPSTKAVGGHDMNLEPEEFRRLVGGDVAARLAAVSVALYEHAARQALERGIIIADTKFEFGFQGDRLLLIDEVLSPDSSRFWAADACQTGRVPQSFDKQDLRDWLDASGWNHAPPPPRLPAEVVRRTAERYGEALRRLFPLAAVELLGKETA